MLHTMDMLLGEIHDYQVNLAVCRGLIRPLGSRSCLMVAVALIRAPIITLLPTVAVQLTRSCISNIKEKYIYHRLCKM